MNKNFLKQKKWYVVLAGASFIGILITFIIRIITPGEVVIPENDFIQTNRDGQKTRFNDLRFSGKIPNLKEKLPLVSLQPSNTTTDYFKDGFIKNHNLKRVEGISGLWKGENYTLSYNDQDDSYLFYSNYVQKDAVISNKEKAIKTAEDYVKDVFSELPLYVYDEEIKKFSGLNQFEEVDTGPYTLLEIPFVYAIEGIPLFVGHRAQAPLTVLINSDFEVQKVVFQTGFFFPLPNEETLKIIPLGDALENINNKNYASIISAYETKTGIFTLDEITGGDLTSVQLEYRADLDSNLAYPFYRFEGEIINNEGKLIQAEIVTPAVKVVE